jgi:hypothetical protein
LVSLTKWIIYGLVGAFAISALVDPTRAQGTIGAFGGIGTALGNLGRGTQSLLTGVGTGAAQLFNPLWTLRDLIYGPQAGAQTQKDVYEIAATGNTANVQQQIQQQKAVVQQQQATGFFPTQVTPQQQVGMTPTYTQQGAEQGAAIAAQDTALGFSYRSVPGLNPTPVTRAIVHGQSMPLSAEAIQYYQALGVAVTPDNNQTVQSNNSQNATASTSTTATTTASSSGGGPLGRAQAAGYSRGVAGSGRKSISRHS